MAQSEKCMEMVDCQNERHEGKLRLRHEGKRDTQRRREHQVHRCEAFICITCVRSSTIMPVVISKEAVGNNPAGTFWILHFGSRHSNRFIYM